MYYFEKKSLIECDINALFHFHLDVSNLKAISPKGISVTLLNKNFQAKEGEILRLKTVKNFIPMIWEVKIEQLNEPTLLVDVALKSPFKTWKHSHIFTQKENNLCELKDVVEYTLPLWFLNPLANIFIKNELQSMFNFRHSVTKELLEANK